ncbi:MAG: hypothetical protein PVH63_01285 [Balneolaceae bacterium]|jgi:hypothetical protein
MANQNTYKKHTSYLAQLVIIPLLVYSCNFNIGPTDWNDFEIDWETKIISVKIDPNPVEVNETVTFTCIIEDSTDPSFDFIWEIQPDYWDSSRVTSKNKFSITAPDTAGTYMGNVQATNYDPDKVRDIRWFNYQVIEKQD